MADDSSLLRSFESLWHYNGLSTSSTPPPHSTAPSPPSPHVDAAERPNLVKTSLSTGPLQSLFSVMDEDGDGRLSLCEMHSLLTKLRIRCSQSTDLGSLTERFTLISADGCSLDFPQFMQFYASLFGASVHCDPSGSVGHHFNDDDDDELLEAFRVYDTNQDGFINAAELAAVLLELGLLPANDQSGVNAHLSRCQAYIERFDLDGDGMVDLDEFKAMMPKPPYSVYISSIV